MKVRPSISVDKDLWDYVKARRELNGSALINELLREWVELEKAREEP